MDPPLREIQESLGTGRKGAGSAGEHADLRHGDAADDILHSFQLSEEDSKKYDVVKAKFESHFVQKRNVIYERAKFNLRKQEPGETVDTFITALYGLAEYCEYGDLHDQMIRDRIVVGFATLICQRSYSWTRL